MQRSVRLLVISATLLVLLVCAALMLVLRPTVQAQRQERRNALARWETHGLLTYRMVLAEANCTTDYEVKAEQIIWGHETPCGRGQARTVTNLFAMTTNDSDSSVCIGVSCLCKRVTSYDVRYDVTLGYPQQITIRTQMWPNWQSAAFWNVLSTHLRNPCSGGSERILTVRGLIPRN